MKVVFFGVLIICVLMSGCVEVDSRLLDSYNEAHDRDIVERFIKNTPTYQMGGKSLNQVTMYSAVCRSTDSKDSEVSSVCWRAVYDFESVYEGYGFREGADLVSGKVKHTIEVRLMDGLVVRGVIDGVWDAVDQKMI